MADCLVVILSRAADNHWHKDSGVLEEKFSVLNPRGTWLLGMCWGMHAIHESPTGEVEI